MQQVMPSGACDWRSPCCLYSATFSSLASRTMRRVAAQLAAAATLCIAGVRISSIGATDDLVLHLGSSYCLLWVVGITNAINLTDRLVSLAAGDRAVASFITAVFAVCNGGAVAVFVLALLGGLAGFLFLNFNPATLFPGDCGSLFPGFVIAASGVLCVAKSADRGGRQASVGDFVVGMADSLVVVAF